MVHDVRAGLPACGCSSVVEHLSRRGSRVRISHPLAGIITLRGCSSVVEHLLAKERVESSNLFIRFLVVFFFGCRSVYSHT